MLDETVKNHTRLTVLPVWACIICYHANVDSLQALASILTPQVDRILLLDNSPGFCIDIEQVCGPKITYVSMSVNVGTAGALNRAWSLAIEGQAGAMVSFDQDSLPTHDLVGKLSRAHHELSRQYGMVAAVGPSIQDPRSGRTARLRRPQTFFRTHQAACSGSPVQVDHLITSGCLITTELYQTVGAFSNDLFLDYVDIEWSLRARALGFHLYVAQNLAMEHTIGDNIMFFGGRTLPIHEPIRNYLLIRNHLLLWRLPAPKLIWLMSDFRQVTLKLLITLAFQPKRVERIRWIVRGIVHGLRGLGGSPHWSSSTQA